MKFDSQVLKNFTAYVNGTVHYKDCIYDTGEHLIGSNGTWEALEQIDMNQGKGDESKNQPKCWIVP